MQDLHHVIEQFGQAVGLPGLAPGLDGVVRIRLEGGEAIGFEVHEQGLVLSHRFAAPFVTGEQLRAALQQAHALRRAQPLPLRLGLIGRGAEASLVVSSRLAPAQADVPQILAVLSQFRAWIERWKSSAR